MEDSGIDSDSKPVANNNVCSAPSNEHPESKKDKDADSCKSDKDQESTSLMKDLSPVSFPLYLNYFICILFNRKFIFI